MNILQPKRYQNNNYVVVDNNSYQPVKCMHDYAPLINSNDTVELYRPAGDVMYRPVPLKAVRLPSQNNVSYLNRSAANTFEQNNTMIQPSPNPQRFF